MEKLSEIISRIMLQRRNERRSRQGPIYENWSAVVGEFLAERSRPVLIRKGVLVVQVTDSVWMHELQMQKVTILEKIRDLVGEGEVVDIRWTITVDGPPKTPRRKSSSLPVLSSRTLDEEEEAWIQAVSAQVEDSALQEQLKRLLSKFLRARDK